MALSEAALKAGAAAENALLQVDQSDPLEPLAPEVRVWARFHRSLDTEAP